MTVWGRLAWGDLVMGREEWLIHLWERVSWFKSREKEKHRRRPNVTLVELVKRTCQLRMW